VDFELKNTQIKTKTGWDRVGEGLLALVLSHHRTYGSVYGGS